MLRRFSLVATSLLTSISASFESISNVAAEVFAFFATPIRTATSESNESFDNSSGDAELFHETDCLT